MSAVKGAINKESRTAIVIDKLILFLSVRNLLNKTKSAF